MGKARCAVAAFVLLGVAGVTCGESISVDWGRARKKVVAAGWEWNAMPFDRILEYADQIDASGVDGISLRLRAMGKDGRMHVSSRVMNGYEWTDAMVSDQVATLREATKHKGLRECFIWTLSAPTNRIDWKDDAIWGRVARSMGVIARFAKATGVRGYIMDPEDYHKQNQFEARPNDEPYDLLAPLARKRGREIFTEVFRAHPDAVVLGYWLFSWHSHHVNSENPMMSARRSGDLWPAFLNGILDVAPSTAKLVDGNEWAYRSEAEQNEFMISAISQRNAVLGLVAPENRAKFRAQVFPGFGLYMDSYVSSVTNENGKTNPFYFGPVNGSRLGHFERNLAEAVECAGEYVWLWCESRSWVKWGEDVAKGLGVPRTRWEDELPGVGRVIRACTDPDAFLAKDFPKLLAAGKIVNIATNDYVAASRQALHGKHDKKEESHRGAGYFHVEDPTARPGQHYVVEASGTGEGLEAVAYWQRRKDGWWRWRVPGHGLAFTKDATGRSSARAVVRVPEGVDCLAIQFRLHPPKGQDCEFDRIFVGRVTY